MKKLILLTALLGLTVPAQAQLNAVEDIDAAITAQYQPQWAGGGDSGIRQANRDWFSGVHLNFVGMNKYPQCIWRDDLWELPIIVLGGALPANENLPNRDDQADDRAMDCKTIYIAENPATLANYVASASLTRGVRFTSTDYLIPESTEPLWADRNGYWVELTYLWTAVDDGVADGARCSSQGEGPVNHNAAWHDCEIPGS